MNSVVMWFWRILLFFAHTATLFKIDHSVHGNGVRDFKWKWWHDSDAKRDQDAKGKSTAKQDAKVDGEELPAMKSKKGKEKKTDPKTAPKKKTGKRLVVS